MYLYFLIFACRLSQSLRIYPEKNEETKAPTKINNKNS